MRSDQRRVDVDDQRPGRPSAERERPSAHRRARRPQRVEQAAIADTVDDAPRRRIRSDGAEQGALITQRAQVTQRVAAVGEHHHQIAHDAAGIVAAPPLAQPRQTARRRPCQPEPISDLAQQRRARVVDRLIVSVRRHRHSYRAAIALHPQGDPPEPGFEPSASRKLPAQPDRTSAPATAGALATARSGLGACSPTHFPELRGWGTVGRVLSARGGTYCATRVPVITIPLESVRFGMRQMLALSHRVEAVLPPGDPCEDGIARR